MPHFPDKIGERKSDNCFQVSVFISYLAFPLMSEKRSFAFPFVAISRTFAELRDSVFVVLKLEFLGISNDRYFLFARSGFDFSLGKTRRPRLGE